jgi:GntR family transcriptional regulator, rspAB operon transcriptional repressor
MLIKEDGYMDNKLATNTTSTREHVYNSLKEQILNLQLAPGTSISEKEISLQFNVSRTPVRESFLRLAQEGLLNIYPQRGTFVSLIDLDLAEEARFMREHLERAVIRLACESFSKDKLMALEMNLSMQKVCIKEKDYRRMFELDEEFHRTIFESCNKSKTWSVIQQMNLHFNRFRMLRLVADYNWDNIFIQHVNILNAIKEKDADKAEKLMQDHLRLAVIDKELLKKSYPNYFK